MICAIANNYPFFANDFWIDKENIKTFVKINNTAVPIAKSQTKEQAVNNFIEQKNQEKIQNKIDYFSKLTKQTQEQLQYLPEELQQVIGFVLLLKPVKSLTGQEFQKDNVKLTDKVPTYYQKQYGGKVKNEEIGEVMLDLEGVRDDIGHGIGSLKASAFMAVPEVIMHGRIFNKHQNWKNRGYDTLVIAAPVEIAGKRYIEEVVVKKTAGRQGFYLHEVDIQEKFEDFLNKAIKKRAEENLQDTTKGGNSPTLRLIIAQKVSEINKKITGQDNSICFDGFYIDEEFERFVADVKK